jgi:hypothetical protein
MTSPIYNIRDCKYVSNVGLFLKCDESNAITYTKNMVINDYTKIRLYDGVVIPVKMDQIRAFFMYVHTIPCKFILATFDCDYTMPFDLLSVEEFYTLVDNPLLIHWYSVNAMDNIHDKLSVIPLGMNLHSIPFSHDIPWGFRLDGNNTPLDVESVLIQKKEAALPFYERIPLCYSNFHFSIYEKYDNARKTAMEQIPAELMVYEPTIIPADRAWEEQAKYAFVVSPHGNGLDCHRTWEALILGCIVVVKSSALDPLYIDLPVLVVEEWSDLTRELLDKTIETFKTMTFNYDKLTAEYWKKKIQSGVP